MLGRLRGLMVGGSLLLTGCASGNCNILSTSHSFGCTAMYAALAVPMAPVALASNAMDDHRNKAWREDVWRHLQANEPAAVATCVLDCLNLPDRLSRQTQHEVYERSVEQVIAWWGEHPEPAQLPALMKAFYYKGTMMMDTDPTQAEVYLRKSAALSVDPRMTAALNTPDFGARINNMSYYDELAENIQANLIVLRYRGLPGREPERAALKDRCQAVAAWPPAWMTSEVKDNLQRACEFAYIKQFDKLAPSGIPVVVEGVVDPLPSSAPTGHDVTVDQNKIARPASL
jgi:hypothetical protein